MPVALKGNGNTSSLNFGIFIINIFTVQKIIVINLQSKSIPRLNQIVCSAKVNTGGAMKGVISK